MTISERLHSTNIGLFPPEFGFAPPDQVCIDQATATFVSPTMRTGFSSNKTEESTLAGSKDLIDIGDVTEIEHAQQREANPDVHLVGNRASLSELLCSEPSPASSATALAANTEDCDHISAFGSASALIRQRPQLRRLRHRRHG